MSLHDELFGSDLDGVEPAKEAGQTVPRGTYHLRIDDCTGRDADSGGKLRVHFQMRIVGGKSHVGKVLFIDLPLYESSEGKRPRTKAVIASNLKRLKDELKLTQATPKAATVDEVNRYGAQFKGREIVATVTEMPASPYVDKETGEEKMGQARNFVIWGTVRHPLSQDENGKRAIEKAKEEWNS